MNMNEHNETGLVEPNLVTPGRVPGTGSTGNISRIGKKQLFTKPETNHHSPQKKCGAPA